MKAILNKHLNALVSAIFVTFIGVGFMPCSAQKNDSITYLKLATYLQMVYESHPIAKQAKLLPLFAKQEVRLATGAFDLGLDIHWNQKDLLSDKYNYEKSITYYRNWNNFIKIPGWIGDFKVGFEQYTGVNVNPENFTPSQGMVYGEVVLPLAKNLIIDERRSQLKIAQYVLTLNEQEKIKIINKVLFQAAKDYWSWYEAYQKWLIALKGARLAQQRQIMTYSAVSRGEMAPVDTIEATLELLKRQMTLSEAQVNFANSRLIVSNHLWTEEGLPAELSENVRPFFQSTKRLTFSKSTLDSLVILASENHPEVIKLNTKQKQLLIEERLRRNQLLPHLEVNYKSLIIPTKKGFDPDYFSRQYYQDNFKVGLDFYMPIFLRKERAKLQSINLKIRHNVLEQDITRRTIVNEVKSVYNDLNNFANQLNMQAQTLKFSQLLLEAEQKNFKVGESSLFMINTRERTLLSAEEKFVELQSKYVKTRINLWWATGVPLFDTNVSD